MTNRRPMHLSQIYSKCKGTLVCSERKDQADYSDKNSDAIAGALSAFLEKITAMGTDGNEKQYPFTQIVFKA